MTISTPNALSQQEAQDLGEALFRAFETGEAVDPPAEARPGLSVDSAYLVQSALLAAHVRAGRSLAGRKIGLTSLAMQRQLGIDSPDFGFLLDSHVWPSGARLSRSELRMIAPKVEPEIAFILDGELRGPGLRAQDVLGATRAIVPVFEVIDSRVRDWRIGLADTVADNASCFGAVLGEAAAPSDVGALPELAVRFGRDGEVLEEGTGAAVMGDPVEAVAWLGNELWRMGVPLPAGQPILAGSFTAALDATPGRYEASFGPALGSVTVEIVD